VQSLERRQSVCRSGACVLDNESIKTSLSPALRRGCFPPQSLLYFFVYLLSSNKQLLSLAWWPYTPYDMSFELEVL
jgi:hypothetical protein